MNCPKCGKQALVIESRPSSRHLRRRRECPDCGHRYTAFELSDTRYEELLDIERRFSKMHKLIKEALS